MTDLKKTVFSYVKKSLSYELDINYLLFIINQSRDQLEKYLREKVGFEVLPSGCLIKSGGPVILTAHMDTINTKMFDYQEDFCYPIPIKVEKGIISKDTKSRMTDDQKKMCLGGDDRCGIFLALVLQKKYPSMFTVIFSDQEEKGHGYNTIELSPHEIWLNKFVICLDSTDKNIFSYHAHLEKELEVLNKKYGFTWEKKSLSNIQYMEGSTGINLGMGYAKQHTPEEYIKIEELKSAYSYVVELSKKLNLK